MSTARLIRNSLATVPRFKMRSGFMMLGSFVGAAALTLVLAVGAAAERKTLNTVRQLFGSSSIVIMAGGTQLMGGPRPGSARLTIDDIEAVAAAVPDIEAWDPQQAMPSAAVRHGDATATARVLGESERSEKVWDRSVSRGAYFDSAAVRSSARVALIGETVAKALFAGSDPIGGEIQIGDVPFQVVGLLQVFGTDLHGLDRDNEIVVPITTLQRRLLNVDTIGMAKLLVRDQNRVEAASKEVDRILRERHGLPTGRPSDYRLISAIAVQQMVAKTQRVLRIYLPLVSLAALLVGGIVAATLMLVSVNQRISEIGLRRAVGARAGDIGMQFLIETAITAVGGGILGIATGLLAARLLATKMALGATFSWKAVLIAFAAASITGLLAGVLPARRAAKLQPADALR